MSGALDGIRIIDVTSVLLGPYATQMLGDMGADVIKVEGPPTGDIARNMGTVRSVNMGGIFLNANRNKRSLALDLKQDAAKEVLRRLIPTGDVFVHNMRPQAMAALGFDYDAVAKLKPDVIYVGPYGFGQDFRARITMPSLSFQDHVRVVRSNLQMKDRLAQGTITADADIDALPEPIDPIRDAPQVIALKLMKRYLNLRYADRDEKRPVSVYLSKIAAEVPLSPFGICAQLENYAAELDRRMAVALESGRRPKERNPALWEENFNDRWPKHDREMKLFRMDLRHLVTELARARSSTLAESTAGNNVTREQDRSDPS